MKGKGKGKREKLRICPGLKETNFTTTDPHILHDPEIKSNALTLSDQRCLGKLKPVKEQAEAINIRPGFSEVLDMRLGLLLSFSPFCVLLLPYMIPSFPISPFFASCVISLV